MAEPKELQVKGKQEVALTQAAFPVLSGTFLQSHQWRLSEQVIWLAVAGKWLR